jgi:GTPase SAR1 family protein
MSQPALTRKINKRVCVVGDVAVGKSNLINNLNGLGPIQRDPNPTKYLATQGVQCYPTSVKDDIRFYEVGGENGMTKSHIEFVAITADLVIVMWDLDRPSTIVRASNWVLLLRQVRPTLSIILVGNKADANRICLDRTCFGMLCRTLRLAQIPYFVTASNDTTSQQNLYNYAIVDQPITA